jgi:hypothetical protein
VAVRDQAGISLTAIPADSELRKPCDRPEPTVGKSKLGLAGEYVVALEECDGRRAGAVQWSDDVVQQFNRAGGGGH